MALNLGAIGKGFALERIARDALAPGVAARARSPPAAAAVSRSAAPIAAGASTSMAAAALRHRLSRRFWLRNAALGTSGAGEQFVEVDGTRYGHVIDPRTGWPASGVLSAAWSRPTRHAPTRSPRRSSSAASIWPRGYCATHPDARAHHAGRWLRAADRRWLVTPAARVARD